MFGRALPHESADPKNGRQRPDTRLCTVLVCLGLIVLLPSGAAGHGSFGERIEAASRAIEADPNDSQLLLVRAELHRRHGDTRQALRDLDHAGVLSPALGRVEYFRGLVYLDAGRHADAEATLRDFLQRQPHHPAGREARARALVRLGKPLAAARAYDLAIAQQPVPIPGYYLERAKALAAAGDPHLKEAIRGIDEGLSRMGPIVTLERVAIDYELRRGDTDAALTRLAIITQRSPRSESWLAQRGDILARAGRRDEAHASFVLALAEMDKLPAQRRHTSAMSSLEAEIRAGLAGLREPPAPRIQPRPGTTP